MSNSYPTNAPEMLSSMARMYNYDLTDFESMLWMGEIFDVYEDGQIIRALKHYMESGTQSRFMPKYGDIKQLLESEDDVMGQLHLLVTRYGSYVTPPVELTPPFILATIEQLGGWVKVCEQMPDASDRIAFAQYTKRVEGAAHLSRKRVTIHSQSPKMLCSRAQAPQLKDGAFKPVAVNALPLSESSIDYSEITDKMSNESKIKCLKAAL